MGMIMKNSKKLLLSFLIVSVFVIDVFGMQNSKGEKRKRTTKTERISKQKKLKIKKEANHLLKKDLNDLAMRCQQSLRKCEKDNIAIFYLLLKDNKLNFLFRHFIEQKDFDPSLLDIHGNTILHLISQDGRLDIIKFLLDYPKFKKVLFQQLCVHNNYGSTPLHLAIENGYLDLVYYFFSDQYFIKPICTGEIKITADIVNLPFNTEMKLWLMNIKEQQEEFEEKLQQGRMKKIKIAMSL